MIVGIFLGMLLLCLWSIVGPTITSVFFLKPWDKDFRSAYQAFESNPPRYEAQMRECIERAKKEEGISVAVIEMHRNLALRLHQQHNYPEGDALMQQAIELGAGAEPKSPVSKALSSVYQDRGYSRYNRWRLDPITWTDNGISDQEKAVELVERDYGPVTVEAINKRCTLALMYFDAEQEDKARQVLDHCYQLVKKDPSLEQNAWFIYATDSRIKGLSRDFRGALETFLTAWDKCGGRQLERSRCLLEFKMGFGGPKLPDDYKEVDEWFQAKQFSKIDALSEKLLKSKECDSQGMWKLEYIPRRIDGRGRGLPTSELKQKIETLKQWIAQNPDSHMARICLAQSWISLTQQRWGRRAWDELSEDDIKVIRNHLSEARRALDSDPKITSKTPCASAIYVDLYSKQEYGGDYDECQKFVDDCHSLWPTFKSTDFEMCRYILLVGGEHSSMRRFMEIRCKSVGGAQGDMLYAQMMVSMLTYFKRNIFEEYRPPLSWDRTRAGLREIINQFPDDYEPRAQFALLAALAKADDETIRSSLK